MPKNKNKQANKKSKTKSSKKKYKVRNWPEYNESLKKRGMLDVYVDEYVLENWDANPNNRRGAQPVYSDLAIQIPSSLAKFLAKSFAKPRG